MGKQPLLAGSGVRVIVPKCHSEDTPKVDPIFVFRARFEPGGVLLKQAVGALGQPFGDAGAVMGGEGPQKHPLRAGTNNRRTRRCGPVWLEWARAC